MPTCARCNERLAPRASACGRCGAPQIAAIDSGHDPQYGMLDLGAGDPELVADPLALETADDPAARGRTARRTTGRRTGATARSGAHEVSAQARTSGGTQRQNQRASAPQPARPKAATGATARSGTMRAVQPAAAQPAQPDPSAITYGRGMLLDDDPFNQAFGSGNAAPALELDEPEPTAPEPQPQAAPEPTAVRRARAIANIARYGPRPTRIIQQPLYWFRVMNRKRALSEELAALSAQRKRADDQAGEAMVQLGEALLSLRHIPELAPLAKQLAAIVDAERRVGHVAAQADRRRDGMAQELARFTAELEREEAQAAPLRAREAKLAARLEQLKARAAHADLLRRKADAELEAMQRNRGGGDVERWGALVAERDARLGEFQSLGIEARPIEDDLAEVQRDLSVRMRKIAGFQEQRRAAATALDRTQQNQRVSVGSAQGARREALLSLANGAVKAGLHELVPEHADAVERTAQDAAKKRRHEDIQRAALNSYDAEAYARGFMLLLGGSVSFLLVLLIAVFF